MPQIHPKPNAVRPSIYAQFLHDREVITLAQQHDAAVVCLTEKTTESTSLGSLVSLRAEAMRKPAPTGNDYFATIRVLKDKRRGPGFEAVEAVSVPAGMV